MLQGARQRLTDGSGADRADADAGVDVGADVDMALDMPFDDD